MRHRHLHPGKVKVMGVDGNKRDKVRLLNTKTMAMARMNGLKTAAD